MSFNQIKLWYKRLTCKHTRRAKFYPSEMVWWWNTQSELKEELHKTIVIEGCLNCHKMWMRDFGE